MDVLLVTTELTPYLRASEAADAVAALAKALRATGHDVTVVVPHAPRLIESGLLLARRLTPVEGWGVQATSYDGQLPSGVRLTSLDVAGAEPASAVGSPAAAWAFARAAAALIQQRAAAGKAPDAVHLHDWTAAPVAALLALGGTPLATVLTVHDGARLGPVDAALAASLSAALGPPQGDDPARRSLLALGLAAAGVVATVSSSHAAELADPAHHPETAAVLLAREGGLEAVPGGIDYAVFNPATDASLASRFDAEDPTNKGRCRAAVVRELGLELEPHRPLLLAAGPIDAAFAELLAAVLPSWLRQELTLVIAGELPAHPGLSAAVARGEGRVAVVPPLADARLRQLLAAADLVLLPPRSTPFNGLALAAQRYGALPVALATGGVLDTVVDVDAELATGTGFLFDAATAAELGGAVARGLAAHVGPHWAPLRRRVMRLDLGWDRPVRRFLQLYARARAALAPAA